MPTTEHKTRFPQGQMSCYYTDRYGTNRVHADGDRTWQQGYQDGQIAAMDGHTYDPCRERFGPTYAAGYMDGWRDQGKEIPTLTDYELDCLSSALNALIKGINAVENKGIQPR